MPERSELSGSSRRSRRSWPVIVGVALGAAALAGCASSGGTAPPAAPAPRSSAASRPGDVPSTAPSSVAERPVAACGSVPSSSGPASAAARLVLTAPATATSGDTIAVQARIEVGSDAPRIITGSAGAQILIVQGRRVVGGTSRSVAAVPVPLRAGTTRPAQALPESVGLVGCTVDTPAPALPPGDYELVGVLGYGGDPLNSAQDGSVQDGVAGGRSFLLVSAPVPIQVR